MVLANASSNSPEIATKIRSSLVEPLTKIAREVSAAVDRRATALALTVLANIYDGEHGYGTLLAIYKSLLHNGSASARATIELLAERYPEKRRVLRQELLEEFTEATEDQRVLIRNT